MPDWSRPGWTGTAACTALTCDASRRWRRSSTISGRRPYNGCGPPRSRSRHPSRDRRNGSGEARGPGVVGTRAGASHLRDADRPDAVRAVDGRRRHARPAAGWDGALDACQRRHVRWSLHRARPRSAGGVQLRMGTRRRRDPTGFDDRRHPAHPDVERCGGGWSIRPGAGSRTRATGGEPAGLSPGRGGVDRSVLPSGDRQVAAGPTAHRAIAHPGVEPTMLG